MFIWATLHPPSFVHVVCTRPLRFQKCPFSHWFLYFCKKSLNFQKSTICHWFSKKFFRNFLEFWQPTITYGIFILNANLLWKMTFEIQPFWIEFVLIYQIFIKASVYVLNCNECCHCIHSLHEWWKLWTWIIIILPLYGTHIK